MAARAWPTSCCGGERRASPAPTCPPSSSCWASTWPASATPSAPTPAPQAISLRRPRRRRLQEAGRRRRRHAAARRHPGRRRRRPTARCSADGRGDMPHARAPRGRCSSPAARRRSRPAWASTRCPTRRTICSLQQRHQGRDLRGHRRRRLHDVGGAQGLHQGRHRLRRLRAAGHRAAEGRAASRPASRCSNHLCEHFAYTPPGAVRPGRASTRIEPFDELLAAPRHGPGLRDLQAGGGVDPGLALATSYILDGEQAALQDTNDHFLANIQRDGTYSVVPRVPGGEITPDQLIAIGEVAKEFGLYTKITGGQRIDLFGARVEQLPAIWARLVDAGFESGHAYGKALRTVKSCVGSTWCRYGVQDSVGHGDPPREPLPGPARARTSSSARCRAAPASAPRRRARTSASSPPRRAGTCTSCGNGGMQPQHAVLLAADLDDETLHPLHRPLPDVLRPHRRPAGAHGDLVQQAGGRHRLPAPGGRSTTRSASAPSSRPTWHATSTPTSASGRRRVEDPERMRRFRPFVNSDEPDPSIVFVRERGQHPARPYRAREALCVLSSERSDDRDAADSRLGRRLRARRPRARPGRVRPGRRRAGRGLPGRHGDEVYAISQLRPVQRGLRAVARHRRLRRATCPRSPRPSTSRRFDLRTGACLDDPTCRHAVPGASGASTAACEVGRAVTLLSRRRGRRTPVDRCAGRRRPTSTAVERFAQRHDAGLAPAPGPVLPRPASRRRRPAPGQQYALRGRPRRLHRLQGVRDRLPQPERPRRRTSRGARSACSTAGTARAAVPADGHHRLPPLRRPGLPDRLPGRRLREGPGHRHRPPPRRPVHRLQLLHADLPVRGADASTPRRGIVRKCDMCRDRLAERRGAGLRAGLPERGHHASAWSTRPTASPTRGGRRRARARRRRRPTSPCPTTRVPLDGAVPDDAGCRRPTSTPRPAHAHPPLAVMLVLTQLVGRARSSSTWRCGPAAGGGRRCVRPTPWSPGARPAGARRQPRSTSAGRCYAWRAVLGLRHSWLSREIVAFGAFAGLAVAYAGAVGLGRRRRRPSTARRLVAGASAGSSAWPAR